MAATILVVGGGFAGRAAVRHFLDAKPPARVILVDDKSFFEFTPSVLRCMVQPNHIQNITFDHQTHSTLEFIEGRVIRLSEEEATVHTRDRGSTSTIPYNYCVWATGVQYAAPITIAHGDTSPTISIRQEEFHDYQSKVLHANQYVFHTGKVFISESPL